MEGMIRVLGSTGGHEWDVLLRTVLRIHIDVCFGICSRVFFAWRWGGLIMDEWIGREARVLVQANKKLVWRLAALLLSCRRGGVCLVV